MAFRRICIFFHCLGAFLEAWRIKCIGGLSGIALPDVLEGEKQLGTEIPFLLACTHSMVRLASAWSGRKCFFRSYIIASVLRRYGQEVELNIGMRNLGAAAVTAGHCWVSMPDGGLLDESGTLPAEYPVFMARSRNGIRYWVGESDSERDATEEREQGGKSG